METVLAHGFVVADALEIIASALYSVLSKMENTNKLFQVFIIESLTPDESEGKLIKGMLELSGIDATLRRVATRRSFFQAITEGIEAMCKKNNLFPILHISAHGLVNIEGKCVGLSLLSEEEVRWTSLQLDLGLVNDQLKSELIICMSTCLGYSFTHLSKKPPYKWLVGNTGEIHPRVSAIGYAVFYHLLREGRTIEEAVEGMKAASGNNDFHLFEGPPTETVANIVRRIKKRAGEVRNIAAKPRRL